MDDIDDDGGQQASSEDSAVGMFDSLCCGLVSSLHMIKDSVDEVI